MSISIMNQYEDEEFKRIVLESNSYISCLKNLGYKSHSGATVNQLKNKISLMNIDTSHFYTLNGKIKRNIENIFVENSTVSQKTLRNWYLKGDYSEYKCSICGQPPIWNGKEMTLILDHSNGNNKDNRLENLRWVCGNCNMQLDTTNGKNKHCKEHELNYCIDCGKVISKSAKRCLSCNGKNNRPKSLPKQITRDELKILLRTMSFVQIGKKYNVSDNAVKKWCEKYNLPKHSSEIYSFTDEEWELI